VSDLRIGHGYDVHRLTEGRPCILCGVTVPHFCGPDGHSDADVPVHALIDAMLGAAALGDIGAMFPDTDLRWKGADSIHLLELAYSRVKALGYSLGNADITIIAQTPKLSPYIQAMRERLSSVLSADISAISVKATTEEGLGITGSGSAIAAHAVVLLV